jgi:hypothetical protein
MGTALGGESLLANITSPGTLHYNSTGLTNGVTYYFMVLAFNSEGNGTLSTEISATPENTVIAPPSVASGLTIGFLVGGVGAVIAVVVLFKKQIIVKDRVKTRSDPSFKPAPDQ